MLPFRVRERAGSADEGFTLIEAVVALTLATIVFTAFASASISGVRSVLTGRTAQQASDIGERALEGMRALGYDSAAMVPGDLGGDPLPIAGCQCYNPADDSTSGATEPLALDDAGGVNPHVLVENINNTDYTVRRYVTLPTDAAGAVYKRLTVVVSWTVRDETRTRTLSSTLAQKRSGLPLPDFKWSPEGAVASCVAPGAEHVFGFTLKNNGARDSWAISTSGGAATWAFYRDDAAGDEPGVHDASDPALTASEVGPIDPTGQELVWAVTNPSSTTTLGTTYLVDFTATSVSQPTYSQTISTALQINDPCAAVPTPSPTATPTTTTTTTASPDPTPTPTEAPPTQPVSCPGSVPGTNANGNTLTSYYLTNGDTNVGSTTASSPLPVSKLAAPSSTTLWPYSTDLSPSPGRHLATSGSTLATTVEWQRQLTASDIAGTGVVSLWGGPASGLSSDQLTFRVVVRQLNSSQGEKKVLVDKTEGSGAWGCAGLKNFGVAVPFGNGNGTKFNANDIISVRVTVSGAAARLGYDTTAMPARIILPVKKGG